MAQRFFSNLLLFFVFFTSVFLSAPVASATESTLPVITNLQVSPGPHTATFRWYTGLPSDSWADMEIPPQFRFRLQPDGSYASIPVAMDPDGSFQNWPHPVTNQMIGRCDGGGNVQNHCVTVVTPFQDTVYPYRVKSCGPDTHGDVHCTRSPVLSFRSSRDTRAPSIPANFRVLSPHLESIWLIWNSATDDHPRSLPGYKIYRNGELVKNFPPGRYVPSDASVPAGTTTAVYYGYLRDRDPAVGVETANTRREWEYIDPNLTPGTTYQYYIKAYDEAGNESASSSVIPATTLSPAPPPPTPAQTPSSKPSTITTSVSSLCCRIDLAWEASTDTIGTNVAVTGYQIYRDGTLLTTAMGTSYSDTNLSPSTTYAYYVRAVDGDGNLSEASPTGRATTPARATAEPVPVPTTPPAAPTNVAGTAFVDGTLVAWVDRASNESSYAIYRREVGSVPWEQLSNTLPAGSASYRDTTVPDTGEHEYRVDACNAAGCTSAARTGLAVHVNSRLPAATTPLTSTTPDATSTTPEETVTTTTAPVRTIENVTTGPSFDKTLARESSVTINDDKALAAPVVAASCESNSLIKSRSSATVYYCGADGKRHVFMNDRVYFSWYTDFGSVRTVSDSELAAVSLGSVITYRPGVKMVKIESDPKVYAIGTGGLLRHVTSEAIAISLYGPNWAKQVDDIPVSLFTKFTLGPAITE